jgi:site-specific DNA recombinase
LGAIGRARRWVDEIMAGGTIAGIASREGKGERQIRLLVPLAFVSPQMVRRLIEDVPPIPTTTELAKGLPLYWTAEGI